MIAQAISMYHTVPTIELQDVRHSRDREDDEQLDADDDTLDDEDRHMPLTAKREGHWCAAAVVSCWAFPCCRCCMLTLLSLLQHAGTPLHFTT